MVSEKLWFVFFSQCLSEQLPHSQYLGLATPVPYLSRQLLQLDILFSCSSSISIQAAFTTFAAASYINGAAPRVSAMLTIHYQSCSESLCYVSCPLPELLLESLLCQLLITEAAPIVSAPLAISTIRDASTTFSAASLTNGAAPEVPLQ